MKSHVKETEPTGVKQYFPKLMISHESGIIVLMTEPGAGPTVGGPSHLEWEYGECLNWDMSYFEDFYGKVTLSND